MQWLAFLVDFRLPLGFLWVACILCSTRLCWHWVGSDLSSFPEPLTSPRLEEQTRVEDLGPNEDVFIDDRWQMLKGAVVEASLTRRHSYRQDLDTGENLTCTKPMRFEDTNSESCTKDRKRKK